MPTLKLKSGWAEKRCPPYLADPNYSKAGNRHIRSALYMPALSAKQHDPYVKAYFEHLVANGKKPLQAICAVMRKLLHAIHGMLKHDKPFENTRFYAIPESDG